MDIAHRPSGKFRLGSLSKQFAAAVILQLAERGRLALDDPIARHFPEAPAAWTEITLFHLLTHTSGIPSLTSLPHFFAQEARLDRSPRELIALTENRPLDFPPGSAFKYNNGAYVILGHVIERLTGQSYETYLRDKHTRPAGPQRDRLRTCRIAPAGAGARLSVQERQNRKRRLSRDERAACRRRDLFDAR